MNFHSLQVNFNTKIIVQRVVKGALIRWTTRQHFYIYIFCSAHSHLFGGWRHGMTWRLIELYKTSAPPKLSFLLDMKLIRWFVVNHFFCRVCYFLFFILYFCLYSNQRLDYFLICRWRDDFFTFCPKIKNKKEQEYTMLSLIEKERRQRLIIRHWIFETPTRTEEVKTFVRSEEKATSVLCVCVCVRCFELIIRSFNINRNSSETS